MYPRFGMAYTAMYTAQARAHASLLQQQENQAPEARAAVLSEIHNDEAGALWRMSAVIVVIMAVAGTVAWFAV